MDEESYSRDDNYNETYGYSQYYYPGYWTNSPRWGRYYAVPWWIEYGWFDNYYNDYYYDGDNGDAPYSTGGRINRGGRFREVSPPPSGSGGGTTGGASTTTEKQPQDNSDQEVKKQNPDDSQSKESKPTRTKGRKK
jgi:hypothetical protein